MEGWPEDQIVTSLQKNKTPLPKKNTSALRQQLLTREGQTMPSSAEREYRGFESHEQ
jgi:hypothetical protein